MKSLNMRAAVAAAALVLGCSPAMAGIGAELNGARANGVWGGELGLGYRVGFAMFDITPAAGAFLYKGDSNGYFTTRDRDGTKHCRAPNGRFAKSERCDNTAAKGYLRLEGGFSIPAGPRIGVGGRYMSGDVRPYGTVSFAPAPMIAIKINGGKSYAAAGITFGF